ncbi:MAG: flagellar hook-basal body complex protein FliE [Thiomonas sp.]|uniref:Flagellar hook-basal body complex protein FliE n=1 Tax=mine drainage metagenome TaxID=410659 RepID=E6PMD5_9ZZZZ|nr:flagellar hook-basal body complex protein FliE [Thiomonas sp. X19]SCC91053.1 Flagellar hook-basal body complex protein FliE [Thiomonas sp. X19]
MNVDRMQELVGQMRSLAAEAAAKPQAGEGMAGAPSTQQTDFAATLQSALDGVNQQMQQAGKLQQQFSAGRSDLSLSDVMLAGQKASLSFQAVLQVRNKLVSAYQDIMNIQA